MSRSIIEATGDADGNVIVADLRNNPSVNYLACEVYDMVFLDENDNVISPSTGQMKFEYTSNTSVWKGFDIGSQRNLINETHQSHIVTGSIIKRVRIYFTGFPIGTKFTCKVYLQSQAMPMIDSQVYGGNKAFTIEPFTEANSKNGTQYETSFGTTLAALNDPNDPDTAFLIIVVGNQPLAIKDLVLQFFSSEIETQIYKDPVFSGGIELPVYNLNDQLAVADDVEIFVDDPSGTAPLVVTSPGTPVGPVVTTLGSDSVGNRAINSVGRGNAVERILWRNRTYCYRIRNNDLNTTTQIRGLSTWYQGELSIEL